MGPTGYHRMPTRRAFANSGEWQLSMAQVRQSEIISYPKSAKATGRSLPRERFTPYPLAAGYLVSTMANGRPLMAL